MEMFNIYISREDIGWLFDSLMLFHTHIYLLAIDSLVTPQGSITGLQSILSFAVGISRFSYKKSYDYF